MSKTRPYFQNSIAQLEQLVEQHRSDDARLRAIAHELKYRETDRALRLRAKITSIMNGLELDLTHKPVPAQAAPTKAGPGPSDAIVGKVAATAPTTPLPGLPQSKPVGVQVRAPAPEATPASSVLSVSATALAAQTAGERTTEKASRPVPMPEPMHLQLQNNTRGEEAVPVIVTRMLDLIEYVIAIEKDKLKLVTDAADHRGFHKSYDDLKELPGIAFNRVLGEDAALMTIERLDRRGPPQPGDTRIRPWLVLTDDPTQTPYLRERLSAAECQQARIPLAEDQTGLELDRYQDASAIRAALEAYAAGPWAEWARTEAARRRTMAVYASLFALKGALAAPDGVPQELVCGVGYATLVRNNRRLCYPLLTIPLDIEIDPNSRVIALLPRAEARPGIEADTLDAMGLVQVDVWRKQALRIIEELEDDSLSPFVRSTFEPILQHAAALLDPDAHYRFGDGLNRHPLSKPGPELEITDGFAFLQRERRATQLMADLQAFREQVEDSDGCIEIPAAVASLFKDPVSQALAEDFPTFRGISSIPGATSSDGSGQDLFFPKPFNAEQVQIAQRLAVRDGVVVQGPPGTGKTHTIANIISHYLATGRRVLVTSQKSPALRVLQEQLPPQIRPLAVSLLDSDREGLRQFRGSVDLISERLQHLRKSDLDQEIASLEVRIDGLHRQLAANDRETELIGRKALAAIELDGQRIEPIEAAREVLAAGSDAHWIADAIGPSPVYDPRWSDEDLAKLRAARQKVGADLCYRELKLPPMDLLADRDALLAAHDSLQRAAGIEQAIADGTILRLRDSTPDTLALAEIIEARLAAWNRQRLSLASPHEEYDHALLDLMGPAGLPIRAALRQLRDEAEALAEDQRFFLTRPVTLPDTWADDPRFKTSVADMAEGGSGLGPLAGLFARSTKALLAAVRLKGKAPATPDDWRTVVRYMDAIERSDSLTHSWNHARTGTKVPVLTTSGPGAGLSALMVLERLEALEAQACEAESLTDEVRKLLPRWTGSIARQLDPEDVLGCLNAHVEMTRLQHARSVRDALLKAIGTGDAPIMQDLRELAHQIGTVHVGRSDLEASLNRCSEHLARLHGLRGDLDVIKTVSDQIQASGAPLWAQQLRSVPAGSSDQLCPGGWRRLWRLRRLDSWLEQSNQSARLRELHQQREQAEADLSKTYVRMIEQRTWRALKERATPGVMQALAAYAVAVGKIGRGTGKSANRHRKTARNAANAVKTALPCWIMPHSRVSESLPAELGIFDLVIVDEASQSTLSALPALFRARQILVVGDDKQVSPDHVGLNMDQANKQASRYLSSQVPLFREPMRQESSLYDLASVIFGADRFMLREHFRCAAPIIEFSKRQFYRNELCPLRLSKASERLEPVLSDVLVLDGYRKGRGKTNPPEADYIIEELKRMAADPVFDGRSIGVTTLLGTEQAALIYSYIERDLGIPFIEKYRIRVGDPAAFQGDERDIMFLSMVATPGNATALVGLPYEQRFNVAASRARERMILVRSIELDQLSPSDNLRRALLEHFRSPFPNDTEAAADARLRCESDFEREMFDALHDRGYALDTQVRVGQHRIDIVVEGDDDLRLAIECDGDRYHGPDQWPADMQRQRTLERAGWRFWRCFASRFIRERQAVLTELCTLLTSLGIMPRTAGQRSVIYTEYKEWRSRDTDFEPDPDADPS